MQGHLFPASGSLEAIAPDNYTSHVGSGIPAPGVAGRDFWRSPLRHIRLFALFLLLPLLFSGCASKPVEMIDKTQTAMDHAKAAHADFFAPEDWKAAETASAQAQTLLDQEKWSEANTALLKAMSRYGKAEEISKDKKEAFLRDVQGIQSSAEKRLKDLKDKAATAKFTAAKQKEINEECKAIEENFTKVPKQLADGLFSDAKLNAQQTARRIWDVTQEYFPTKK
jgi:hypothetical protein